MYSPFSNDQQKGAGQPSAELGSRSGVLAGCPSSLSERRCGSSGGLFSAPTQAQGLPTPSSQSSGRDGSGLQGTLAFWRVTVSPPPRGVHRSLAWATAGPAPHAGSQPSCPCPVRRRRRGAPHTHRRRGRNARPRADSSKWAESRAGTAQLSPVPGAAHSGASKMAASPRTPSVSLN